jgi:cyclopropane fatty-acyl-phospholipid synthase-like methyltransferase
VDNTSFKEFIEKSQALSQISIYQNVQNLKNKGGNLKNIMGKKLHEISTINQFLKEKKVSQVLEIGGGKGNLSYVLCKEQDISAISIDMNEEF